MQDCGVTETEAAEVIDFWRAVGRGRWFVSDTALDEELRRRFAPLHGRMSHSSMAQALTSPQRALATLIVFDQFSRNMFRATPKMFETDELARSIAASAIVCGFDREVEDDVRIFFFLPFEHSEDLADQNRSVELFQTLGDAEYARFAEAHLRIIQRFGRFPHRNDILGRKSTPEETEFLKTEGSSF